MVPAVADLTLPKAGRGVKRDGHAWRCEPAKMPEDGTGWFVRRAARRVQAGERDLTVSATVL